MNNYKSGKKFIAKNEPWRVHNLVDVEIIGLQEMLKLVSCRLETQPDTRYTFVFIILSRNKWDDRLEEVTRTGIEDAESELRSA
jgi:hypothetical protein